MLHLVDQAELALLCRIVKCTAARCTSRLQLFLEPAHMHNQLMHALAVCADT